MALRGRIEEEKHKDWSTPKKIYVGCGCALLFFVGIAVLFLALFYAVIMDEQPVIDPVNLLVEDATGFATIRFDMNDPGLSDLIVEHAEKLRDAQVEGMPPETQNFVKMLKPYPFVDPWKLISPVQATLILSRPQTKSAKKDKEEGGAEKPKPRPRKTWVGSQIISFGKGGIIMRWLFRNHVETMVVVDKRAVTKNYKGVAMCVEQTQTGGTRSFINNNLILGADEEITKDIIDQIKKAKPAPAGSNDVLETVAQLNTNADLYGLVTNTRGEIYSYLDEAAERFKPVGEEKASDEARERYQDFEILTRARMGGVHIVHFDFDLQPDNIADVNLYVKCTSVPGAQNMRRVLREYADRTTKKYAYDVTDLSISDTTVKVAVKIKSFTGFVKALHEAMQPEEEPEAEAEDATEAGEEASEDAAQEPEPE